MSNFQQSLHSGEPGTTGRELFEGSTATGAGEHAQSFGTGYKEGTEAGDKGNHGEHDTDLGSGPHGRSSSRSGGGANINPGQALTGVAGSGQHSTHSSGLHQNTGITGGISGQHAGTGAGAEMHSSSGQGQAHQSLGDKARAAVSSSTTDHSSSGGGRAHGDHVHSAHQDSTGHMIDRGADPHMHQHGADVQQGSGRTFDNTQSSGKATDAALAASGGSATGAYPSYEGVSGHSGSGTGALSGQPANIGSARGDNVVSGSKVGAGAGLGAAAGAAATSRSGDHGATAQSASLQGDVNKASQHGLHNQFDHADDSLLKNQRSKADVPTDGNINLDSANPANIAKDKAASKADQAGNEVDQESGKGGLVDKIRHAVGM